MTRGIRATAIACAASAAFVARGALAAETRIDDFESPSSPAPWVFSNGSEFPGATGSLSSGSGHAGKGAHLAYDFGGGGHYVSATLSLATPVTAAAIAFWVRASPGIHATLRVRDATGQTLQYDGSRPFDSFDASTWYRQVVALDGPTSHFGGANDGAVHQPIAAVTVLAADPIEPGASGSVDFDDVVAIDALAPAIDLAAQPASPPPPASAALEPRIGVNIHFTKDDAALDIARGIGFSWARMDLGWSGVESHAGVYDFTALDGLVASLAQRGMRLLLILDYFDALYPGADASTFGTVTVPAFATMAKAAASHFAGKGVAFEVWNEPNLAGFWPPAPDASQYAALCKAAIAAVHQGDPNALVSTGGVSQFDFAFLRGNLDAGGGTGADAIGVHPYRQGGGESAGDDLVLLRSIVASALSPAPPVWATEWGYSATWYGGGHDAAPRARQAQFAARELLSAWALGLPLVIYYDIRDDGTDPSNAENNFGLVAADGSDKPAAVALRTLTSMAKGRTLAGSLAMEPTSLRALRLDGPGDTVVAIWSTAPGATVTVRVPATATAQGMLGAPATLGAQGGVQMLTLKTDDGPVYVTIPGPPPGMDAGVDAAVSGIADAAPGPRDATVDDDAAIGDGGGVAAIDADPGQGDGASPATSTSGCGCTAAGSRGESAGLAAFGAAALLVRRRRARRPGAGKIAGPARRPIE